MFIAVSYTHLCEEAVECRWFLSRKERTVKNVNGKIFKKKCFLAISFNVYRSISYLRIERNSFKVIVVFNKSQRVFQQF